MSTEGATMHPDDADDWRARNVPVFNDNRFKLGVFGQNCSNGCTITHAETTFEPTYEPGLVFCLPSDQCEVIAGLAISLSMWQCAGHGDAAFPGFVH